MADELFYLDDGELAGDVVKPIWPDNFLRSKASIKAMVFRNRRKHGKRL
jgi:hypothetical protein